MHYSTASRNEEVLGTIFWKEVEEGWIRYEQKTGNTQLFTPLARFAFDLINKSPAPLSLSAIANEVQREEPDTEPSECLVEVESVLRILSEAQLILPIQL